MSSVTKLTNLDEIYGDASLWIARMDRGLSDEEEKQLGLWMNEHPKHREILLAMATQWDKMDSLSRLASMFPHQPIERPESSKRTSVGARLAGWVTGIQRPLVGFVVASALVFTLLFFRDVESPVAPISQLPLAFETAVGEQSSIVLSDGSHLRLNTNSLVEVVFSDTQRALHLIRGELNVDVAHDTSRPLRVFANGRVVEAVGTVFNVEITPLQQVELVVTEGEVLVTSVQEVLSPAHTTSQASFVEPAPSVLPIAVSEGHEILLGGAAETLKEIDPVDARVKLSWQEGTLVFRGESLEQAMAEVGRYTTVEFVFLDESSKQVRVAGLFQAGDTGALLAALRENFDVDSHWEGSGKVLLSAL